VFAGHLETRAVGERARTDLYGDPMPPGAVARLGTLRWRLPLPDPHVSAFAPDGKTFVTASPYGGILVWDSARGAVVRQVAADDPHSLSNTCWAFSADTTTLAVGRSLGTIVVLDVATGKERCRCLGHRGRVRQLALSADGTVLVSEADDGTVRVWDARAGRERRRQQLPVIESKNTVQYRSAAIALTGAGKTLAWALQVWQGDKSKHVIHVCDTASGQERHALSGHQGMIRGLAFSRDGQMLASVGEDALKAWDVRTGPAFQGLGGQGVGLVAFSPDGKKLAATCFPPHQTRVFETATGRELWAAPEITFGPGHLLFTPDGKTLVVAGRQAWPGRHASLIERFDAASGQERVDHPGHHSSVQGVAFSADAHTLVSTGSDSALNVWDATTGKHVRRQSIGPVTGPAPDPPAVASSDGRRFVTLGRKEFRLQEADTGRVLSAWDSEEFAVAAVSFSPDGRAVAAPVGAGAVTLRDAGTGKVLRQCRGLSAASRTTFSAVGDLLLAGGFSPGSETSRDPLMEAAVWDVATGRPRRLLRNLPCPLGPMALSRDGRGLALIRAGGQQIELREVASGQVRLRLPQMGSVQALALSPDGDVLVTSCDEARPADPGVSFRCYDLRDGRLLCERRGHRGPVRALAFSADGRRLATASDDTTALVWDLPSLLPPRPAPAGAGPPELEVLWADLAGDNAPRAYRTVLALAAAPGRAVPFLRTRLRPAPASVEPDQLARLVADLDAARFRVRAKAEAELERLGEAAEPALERSLAGAPSLEKRRRVAQLLDKVGKLREKAPPPERLRQVRALEVLERSGTREARQLLQVLAGGAADAWLTDEAGAALRRLEQHRPAAP
jgi:WD40 repeat protein